MNCRLKWFRRTLRLARERRETWQLILARGVKLHCPYTDQEYRAALFNPYWSIARWNGHHWRVFDKAPTLATLQWRYGGTHFR